MKSEENISIIDITKPRYERLGECNQCGACCIGEGCESLTWKDGKAFCKIHEERRPDKCVLFPANPPIVFKGCSYIFRDKWENKILKAGEV